MGSCWCKELCLQHASVNWQDWWSKGEEAGPLSYHSVCHMSGTASGVTTNYFLRSYKLTNFLLTKNMTWLAYKGRISLKFQNYFSVVNKERSILLNLFYQWPNTSTIHTSKRQGCHSLFIRASWQHSWFQTFAMFWMLYAFFWVILRRLNFMCRCFGTLSVPSL